MLKILPNENILFTQWLHITLELITSRRGNSIFFRHIFFRFDFYLVSSFISFCIQDFKGKESSYARIMSFPSVVLVVKKALDSRS